MTTSNDLPRLPTIDLSLFDIGDPWRDHVAAQVDWAASRFGAFQMVGHGVDPNLMETLAELAGKFLSRRGARSREAELPGFQDTLREYATTMTGLAHKLMAAMARGLRLDDGFFADHYTGNPTTALRLRNHPVSLPVAGAVGRRAAPSSAERGLLTIVSPGDLDAYQIAGDDGQWLDVPALPGALLCQVGPVLERLTHGHYVSAEHRVGGEQMGERPSVSFSFEPGADAVLTPVPALRPRRAPAGYVAPAATAMTSRRVADSAQLR